MRDMLIVADDVSGAADCGIACARHGLNTVVLLRDTQSDLHTDVLSVDGNTRHLDAQQAAHETARLVRRYARHEGRHQERHQGQLLFKKLDSTLRGHVAAELAAALETQRSLVGHPQRIVAVLAPAFPATGRTTVHGRQHVHGKPLEETDLWQRERFPARSYLPELFQAVGVHTGSIGLTDIRNGQGDLQNSMKKLASAADVLICDAETDEDLRAIAEASMVLGRNTVWAGSAGLASHLPQAAGFAIGGVLPDSLLSQQPLARGPALFLIGSLSSVSREQAKTLAASPSIVSVTIPPDTLLAGEASPAWREHAQTIENALDAGLDVVAGPGAALHDSTMGQMLSAALARMVKPFAGRVGSLVATGGETARAVLEAWDMHRLQLIGELEAGVTFAVTDQGSRLLPVLLKAGAFGTPRTFIHCREFLRALDRSQIQTFFARKGP